MPTLPPRPDVEITDTSMWRALALLVAASVGVTFFVVTIAPPVKKITVPLSQTAAVVAPSEFDTVRLVGKAAVVIDIKTGATLFVFNADTQLPLASLTKVPMVLAVSETLSPDDLMTIPYDTAPSSSGRRLTKGARWRVQDVIDFTLVASSNEGATMLAAAADAGLRQKYPQAPVGSATLWRMNDLARTLGLEHTYFLNVNGLDIDATHSGAYGSARDVAKLFAYAESADSSLFSDTRRDDISLTSPDGKHVTSAINTNEAQGEIPGLVMGKTGYTDLAGGNLAIVFDVGLSHPVVAVVLGSTRDV